MTTNYRNQNSHRLFIIPGFVFYGAHYITNHRNGLNLTTGNNTRPLRYHAETAELKTKNFLGRYYKIEMNICSGRHVRFYY